MSSRPGKFRSFANGDCWDVLSWEITSVPFHDLCTCVRPPHQTLPHESLLGDWAFLQVDAGHPGSLFCSDSYTKV